MPKSENKLGSLKDSIMQSLDDAQEALQRDQAKTRALLEKVKQSQAAYASASAAEDINLPSLVEQLRAENAALISKLQEQDKKYTTLTEMYLQTLEAQTSTSGRREAEISYLNSEVERCNREIAALKAHIAIEAREKTRLTSTPPSTPQSSPTTPVAMMPDSPLSEATAITHTLTGHSAPSLFLHV